ncbi:MAG: DNA starvation/stationary phase protection protein Dps [Chloroflexi bacterium]|nr:DNA starvation/stationary phase protection protein Dps [Chloroflexota bacterium]
MATPTSTSFQTQIDIPEESRAEIVTLLNQALANTFDLYSQTKQAHWNVKGMHFIALHQLFDQLADGIFPYADMLAERVTALGGMALGTARMAAEASSLPPYPVETVEGEELVRVLIDRYSAYTAMTRAAVDKTEDLNDMASSDLFVEITREADKFLYFLEAHIQQ